jgi:hypothetical protein
MNQGNVDNLTYKKKSLAGKPVCTAKKEDVAAAKKPKVVIPDNLKLL